MHHVKVHVHVVWVCAEFYESLPKRVYRGCFEHTGSQSAWRGVCDTKVALMTITLDNHYVTIKHLNYLKQQTLQVDGILW